jgi:hypothetical protein
MEKKKKKNYGGGLNVGVNRRFQSLTVRPQATA